MRHASRRSEVKREIEHKVAVRAKQRIDSEADSRLDRTAQRLRAEMLQPLENLALKPEMLSAETTDERMVMQLRLATERQLSAHTHRPWAPSDSLFSLQIHQTAINNILNRLKLDGVTITLGELRSRVTEQLNLHLSLADDAQYDDVEITFAKRDAVHVDCRDGRIAITLSIEKLKSSRQVWRDFQVLAYYRVQVEGLSAELVRDGSIRMIGRRVRASSQFALRSIFGKVFSHNAARQMIPERILNNENMSDQMVTQFKIEDGWVALAMGPKRQK